MKHTSRLAAVFSVMSLTLIASVAAMYWMGLVTLRSGERLVHQHSLVSALSQTLSTIKDAETGQRGFLLTGDPSYLDPYHDAIEQINRRLSALAAESRHGHLNPQDVALLTSLTHEKLDVLERSISLLKNHQSDQALLLVRLGEGKQTMHAIRGKVAAMVAEAENHLAETQAVTNRLTAARTSLFGVVALVNLGFLYWAYLVVRNEMAGRAAAAKQVAEQKELLSVTLASIGDAVIVTDTGGRITFINDVAAKLTGWPVEEAMGKPCAKVFDIICEDTRQVVESPVDKVLKLGLVVGLANHTLLIRKDGSEVPIDDSGAPIRDADGAVRGVVLIFRDFSEHKNNEKRLCAAKADLEAASRAKDQFLATLSHELRTPLTPVLATLTTWEASDELPEPFREDVQMLRRNIALEARLIDDLLDLTRIVRGKLPLEIEVVDLHDLLRSVSGMYRSEMHVKRVNLVFSLEATKHYAEADPGRMQQVFWNILKNATKFTPEGGRIEIKTLDGPEGQIRIVFQDSGIGMSEQMLDRLFKPFEQGAEEVVRRAGGLGLGMAISKALVDIQKGSIAASSEGAGKGSTFTVTMPSVPTPRDPVAARTERESRSRPQSRLLSILLVEDHVDTARVMGRLLRRLGHTVETSETVAGALTLARDRNYDILLSDIGLPDGTGLELIRQIHSMKKIPAVALTGFGMDDDIAKCLEAGFMAHLTKPVNFHRLEMVIQQVAESNLK